MRAQSIKVMIDNKYQSIKPIDLLTKKSQEFLVFIDKDGVEKTMRVDLIMFQK